MSSPVPPAAGAGIEISSKRTRVGTRAFGPVAADRAQDAAAAAAADVTEAKSTSAAASSGGRGGSIPKAIVALSCGAAGDTRRYGRRVGYSTDTDSSAGSGRGRKKTSSKRSRSYTKNGKNGSHHNLHEHQHPQNGSTVTVTRNGYQQHNLHHPKQNGVHHQHNTRGSGGGGGGHKRTEMAKCYEGMAEDTKLAAGGSFRAIDGSMGMGSADEGVPSHVGLVHAVLSRCASGYDSGSVGDGPGALARSPRASPLPPPMNSAALPLPRMPGSHSHCASDGEQMSAAGNAPRSLPGDADSQKSLDMSESQADQVNSDRDDPFDSRYRDVDNSSQCDTSQADTAQYLGHSDRDSIAGYHTDTGAMSDGNSITAPKQHHPSSRGGSVVGMSERSRSSGGAGSGIVDRPPGKVTIARPIQYPPMPPMVVGPGAGFHSLEAIASLHHNFPTASTSYGGPPSVSGKSDNATVNSGSMIEDIDMASIMSGDGSIVIGGGGEKGQQRACASPPSAAADTATGAAAVSQPSSHQSMLPQHSVLTKRSAEHSHHKHDRGVEFAAWAQSYPAPHPWLEGKDAAAITASTTASTTTKPSKSPTPPGTVVAVAPTGALLNDMGPPLSRSILLERIAGAAGLAHPPMPSGHHSRSGSVASGASVGRPSDVSAHVDTDDCGGSLLGSEENRSVHSRESPDHMHDRVPKSPRHGVAIGDLSDDNTKVPSAPSSPPRPKDSNDQGEHGNDGVSGDGGNVDTALLSSSQTAVTGNGRRSPGGTVYRGRGTRRYQGRYRRGRGRSRSRSRSRSRDREEEEEEEDRRMPSWSGERAPSSRSPSPRWSNDGCVRRSRRNRGRR